MSTTIKLGRPVSIKLPSQRATVVAPLALGRPGPAGPSGPAGPPSSPLARIDAAKTALLDPRDADSTVEWAGGDACDNIRMPNGKDLFFWGDTFIADVTEAGAFVGAPAFHRRSISMIDPATGTTTLYDENSSLLTPLKTLPGGVAGEWAWFSGVAGDDSGTKALAFAYGIVPTGDGAWDFAFSGRTYLADFNITGSAPTLTSWTLWRTETMPGGIAWGDAAYLDPDGYVYVYGYKAVAGQHDVYVRRCLPATPGTQQVWTGSWTTSGTAVPVGRFPACPTGIRKIGSAYLALVAPFYGSALEVWTSASLTGGWTKVTDVWAYPKTGEVFYYAPRWVPQWDDATGLAVIVAHNAAIGTTLEPMDYVPDVIRVSRLVAGGIPGPPGTSADWAAITSKPAEFAPADHSASKVTSGVFAPARLGSGTANSSKWLRGDGSWQDAPAGDPIEMVKLSAYCSGDGTDEAAAFQAAVDVCLSTGASLLCDVRDPIHVSSGVTIGDARANSQQRVIFTAIGALRLKARTGASIARLLTIRGTVSTQACHMEIDANGTTSGVGIWATNFGRSKLGHVHTFGFKVSNFYIEPVGNNNLWSALSIRATAGGTKHVVTATCSALSAGSGWASTDAEDAPYSTWTLDTALPAALQAETKSATAIIFADGRYMYVKRVVSATSIEVWNENRPTGTSESVTILGASLNWPYYGDSGEFYVGQMDVRDNPNAVAVAYGGYGGTIGVYCQQNNFGGFFITQRAHGISFPYFYTELSGVWLICRDSAQTQVFVGPGVNSTPTNFQAIDKSWMALAGRNSQALNWYISKSSGSPIVSPPALPLDRPELQPGTRNITPGNLTAFRRTSGAATLRINNNYPSAVGSVDLAGPASGSGTDVSITLLNTSLGHTIEGGSTFTAKVYAAARVDVWLESGQTDWKVRIWDGRSSTATSVASAPAFVGQMAVASGLGYIATGTASSSDWKQITN